MQIRLSNISFRYSDSPVLRDISFDAAPGEFISVLGPNGAGKSTLLRLISRIILPEKGSIQIGGQSVAAYDRNRLARIVGYVPQETSWYFPFTVMEVVLMGRTPYVGKLGFESDEDLRQAMTAMEQTDITRLADKPITAISGGERQRVLIARALAQRPRILLLDEPNAHLDLSHQLDVFRILRQQQVDHEITVVSVSHDLNLAAAFSTKVLLLANDPPGTGNTVIASGSPNEVLTKENIQRAFHTDVIVNRHDPEGPLHILLDVDSPPTRRSLS